MKFNILLLILMISTVWVCAEDSKILSWTSASGLDSKVKRKFSAKFKIKLGDMWKDEKPELLIKTLDEDDCIMQVSDVVAYTDEATEIELAVPWLVEFKSYRLCIRTKHKIEYFRQTWVKKEKEPIKEELVLGEGVANVVFFKKIEANSVGKSVSDCKLTGSVINTGAAQAKMIRIKATITNALSEKIKEFEFLLEQDKKPVILDGGDKFKIDRIEGGCKGFAGGRFGITWEGGKDKEIQVDSGIVTSGESVFEYGKTEGDVQITKIVAKVINRNDLSLNITIYNGLGKTMFNPVITIKLTNDKGEVIQPITLEFEGELASKETAEIPFEHKNAPPFNGIQQSIKYSTKN